MRESIKNKTFLFLLFFLVSSLVNSQIIDSVSSPVELWQRLKKSLPSSDVRIYKDEIVDSYTDPGKKLRRLEFSFTSQEYEGENWIHPCVLFVPTHNKSYGETPGSKGKVVIVAHAGGSEMEPFLLNYGDPIATLTGYPTLVFQNPGEGREGDFRIFVEREMQKLTPDPVDHSYFRTAVPYLVALDIVADLLKIRRKDISAIVGGHSKRATAAYNAAAMDSSRISGVVYMGNESVWGITEGYPSVCPARIQKWVKAEVLYIGASNEAYRPGKYEYHMYNINKIQEMMRGAWTIEYIPNYIHFAMSERHFIDWRMWVGHVFEGRPVTSITELTWQKIETGTRFRAKIESDNKVIQVMLWHTYTGNVPPYWRDLFWRPSLMVRQDDGYYEGFVGGEIPDAWLVEVKDIGSGISGYVTSLPQDITGKRNWQVGD